MKNIIIITGHAHYASGLLSSFEMIMGPNADIYAIDFDETKNIVEQYQDIINKNTGANFIFMCDMLGGTPFKESAKIAHNQPNIKVLVGCNLGALIEISFIKDLLSIEDLANKIIESSIKHTSIFKEIKKEESSVNDGI